GPAVPARQVAGQGQLPHHVYRTRRAVDSPRVAGEGRRTRRLEDGQRYARARRVQQAPSLGIAQRVDDGVYHLAAHTNSSSGQTHPYGVATISGTTQIPSVGEHAPSKQ